MMEWRTLVCCLIIANVQAQLSENEETDSPSSRRILGSSVVTSVSVVMETGNGKHTYYSDAVGHPLSKPHIASQVASPINLLNPDRYEFYTFNDDGELVKRLMTLEEIQGIIAGGDGEPSNYNSEFNSQILNPENDVSGIVENVQNVLKEEIEAHKNPPSDHPMIDTPDVSANWNLILPAFFGDGIPNEAITPNEDNYVSVSQKYNDGTTTEHISVASRMPPDLESNDLSNEYNLPIEVTSISTPTEPRIEQSSEKLTTINLNTTTTTTTTSTTIKPIITNKIDNLSSIATSDLPLQTNTIEDIFTFDTEIQDEITTLKLDSEDVKINLPIITERVNAQDSTIEAQTSTQSDEYPKIIELVSMITRPTIKTTEKITTMRTSSVTFPPSTQFTHYEQITQSSSLKPVSNGEENYKTSSEASTPVNDNFVILSLNDNKNDSNPNVNNTANLINDFMTYMPQNVSSNVEQIITNVSNDIIMSNEKITTENYNASNLIEDTVNATTMPPDLKNNIITFASAIIEPNRTTVITTEKFTTSNTVPASEFVRVSNDNIQTNSISEITTKPFSRPIVFTTPSTTIEDNSQKFSTFSQIDTTRNSLPTTKIRSPTTSTTTTTTSTTEPPQVSTTTTTTEPPQISTTTTTEPPQISTTTTTEPPQASTTTEKEIFISPMQQIPLIRGTEIPISSTSEETFTPIMIANRFAMVTPTIQNNSITSNTEANESNETTEYTKISQSTLMPLKTTTTTTTTQTTSTFKPTTIALTSATTKKSHNEMETTKPYTKTESSSSTFTSSSEENTTVPTDATTSKIMSSVDSTITSSVTTDGASNKTVLSTSIIGTASMSSSTVPSVLNISEPYRRTEEMHNKKPLIDDPWKLVETVKPSEIMNKTTPVVLSTIKPTFKPIEAYQSTKVDLSTQGNYGMPALSEDMYMFSKMYNELALKFWNALSVNDISSERSAIVSPFGTISMLAMIFLGARGGTSGEMNDVLKLDDIVSFNPHLVFKEVTDSVIVRKSPSAIVRELYSDSNKGKVLDFYKARVRYFYDGHVEEVDFKKIHNVIRRRTNSLISKQTRGQMPQYLEETTLSLRAPLSTLSTNIFQADCSHASTEGRDGEFYFIVLPSIRQRRLVPIPAAVWRSGFIAGYDPELDATAVSLGTLSQAVSTIFVMPGQQGHSAPGDVLLRLEARLLNTTYIPEIWNQLLKSMLPRPGLEIQLPRFLHKSVINTTESLKRMGLKEMFNKNKASLQGLNGIGHDLYFSDMMQVNEFSICGENQQMHTEIYPSVTEHLANHNEQMRNFKYVDYLEENEYDKYLSIPLPLRPRQARLPEVPKLRFDRPFLYFVRHNPTGLILHMGRFNPKLLT